MVQHSFRHTAEHQALDRAVSVRPEHDDVGPPILCELDDHVGRSAEEEDGCERARRQAFNGNQVIQTAFRAGRQVSSQFVEIHADGFGSPWLLKRVGYDVGDEETGARRGPGEANPVTQNVGRHVAQINGDDDG
jgi:hypothetical protein